MCLLWPKSTPINCARFDKSRDGLRVHEHIRVESVLQQPQFLNAKLSFIISARTCHQIVSALYRQPATKCTRARAAKKRSAQRRLSTQRSPIQATTITLTQTQHFTPRAKSTGICKYETRMRQKITSFVCVRKAARAFWRSEAASPH